MTTELKHHQLSVNGIELHVAEQGSGPLVLLCHGWPELWSSYRHQLAGLAAAGYRAVAPDMRGYGDSSAPSDIAAYSIFHLVGDMVALVTALGEQRATIVGHDWGATVAWQAALMRPDVFPAVVGMSVPARRRGPRAPLEMLRAAGLHDFYWIYFQEPGVAEAEFERDLAQTFRRLLYPTPGQGTGKGLSVPSGKGFLDSMSEPAEPPSWIGPAEIDVLVKAYKRSGFRGGLNWYRNLDRNWELTAPFQGATIRQPALFIGGSKDPVLLGPTGEAALRDLEQIVPGLTRKLILEGAGHWVNEERPEPVNDALIAFLKEHAARS